VICVALSPIYRGSFGNILFVRDIKHDSESLNHVHPIFYEFIVDASERQVARSLVYPTDTCFSRALGQSEKIVCAANSASTTALWTYYSDASCTTVSATPAVSLAVRFQWG
jgi:hypothetical protein